MDCERIEPQNTLSRSLSTLCFSTICYLLSTICYLLSTIYYLFISCSPLFMGWTPLWMGWGFICMGWDPLCILVPLGDRLHTYFAFSLQHQVVSPLIKGPPCEKNRLLFTWEKKKLLNKTYMYYEILNIVCFLTFSVKCKENDLHRKYRLFGGLAENLPSPTISQIEQNCWLYFIYKALEQSVTVGVF